MTLKQAMNGAKIPNWARLVAYGIGLGWIAASQWAAVAVTKHTTEAVGDSTAIAFGKLRGGLWRVEQRMNAIEDDVEQSNATSRKTRAAIERLDDQLDQVSVDLNRLSRRRY